MTEAVDTRNKDCSASLYVGIDELRRRINPKIGRDSFIAKVKAATDKEGFPRFSEFWAGWYWPAVRGWLDKKNGLANDDRSDSIDQLQEDGPENFDAATIRKARPETRPPQPPLLGRTERGPRYSGLSGQGDPVAARGR